MILVTGGTGIVGAHLLLELAKKEDSVRAIYRTEEKIKSTKKIFDYYSDTPESLFDCIHWVKAEINDLGSLQSAFDGVKKVYHAAALVSFDPKDDKNLMKTNIEGTANLVNLCIANAIEKLCFVSSIAALGTATDGKMVSEQTEWTESSSTYGLSKHYAEMEVWRASQEGVPVVIVNPGIIIAAGFWKSSSGSFFHHASKGPKYYLPSGTGFVGVNEVVRVMVLLMDGKINNARYVLVNENWTYQKFAELLAIGLGKPVPKKEIKPWMLAIFWRLDWIRSTVFGKRRRLSKSTAQLFRSRDLYDNSKLLNDLDFEYDNLEKTVQHCCTIYLEEFGS